jgi:hypothetical protein
MLSFLGKAAWKIRDLLPRKSAAPASSNVDFRIDQFMIFAGVVNVSGWLWNRRSPLTRLHFLTSHGTRYPIDNINQPSADVAAVMGATASHCRFTGRFQVSQPSAEVVAGTIVAEFDDGSSESFANLGTRHLADDPGHRLLHKFLAQLSSMQSGAALEIGSRARSGVTRRQFLPSSWAYTGMDILAGENVDVVGDAHKLSKLFPQKRFRAVMSFSVLEHLLMPWKFAIELNRVMEPGGVGFFITHQCWPLHDQPWDFWRFSSDAWASIFNRATGFEIIEAAMGEPAFVVANRCHAATNFVEHPAGFLASSVLFRKIGETNLAWDVDIDDVLNNSYPDVITKVPV